MQYFGHIKRHGTLMKTYWINNSKEGQREVDNDVSGKVTSRGARSVVYQCTNRSRDRVCMGFTAAKLSCEDGT